MGIKTYTIENFDYSVISKSKVLKRRKGNPGTKLTNKKYLNLFTAFDIEATNDLSIGNAFMYIWQFQIEDNTIIGRTWDEFLDFLNRIVKLLGDNVYIVIYVHNLSYEFSFLKGIYDFTNDEVFAIEPRKVLKCEMLDHFEFRCSYLLTNMSLKVFTKKMGVPEKLSGDDYDYSKIRYPWTELTDLELEYCITDVRSLVLALKKYYSIENDNFYSIPLTSTGFVRRDVRSAMRKFNKGYLNKMLPDYKLFTLLREAFRGGNTHANRYYSDIINNNVVSYDKVSSYPDVQINELFPMSEFIYEKNVDMSRVIRKIYKQKRACIMRLYFTGLRLKDPMWGCPYIPKHKCRNLKGYYADNGRILYADYLELTVTDIDFKIILNEYKFDSVSVSDFYHARYGKLPKPLRDTIIKYYQDKTKLKGVKGQELFYMLTKAKLNSIYGMSVQSPVKQSIDYEEGIFKGRIDNEEELLEQSNKKAFLVYAWGVWTTARAREQLEIAIRMVGNNFIYCDTDSVKFLYDPEIDFKNYNDKRKRESTKNGGYATDLKNNKYYLGLFDYEGRYKKFVTMGAKKYAYVDQDNILHLTVAGVGKSKGVNELQNAGGINKFKEGFIFSEGGGTESVYNDFPEIKEIKREGHKLKITANVLIKNSTYTLGITGEYKRILEHPKIWLDLFK